MMAIQVFASLCSHCVRVSESVDMVYSEMIRAFYCHLEYSGVQFYMYMSLTTGTVNL